MLGGTLHHLGGSVAQLEELLVYLVLEQLHVLYGLVDGVFLDVIARHLEGRGTGGRGQGCDLTGGARGYWLVSDVVLDGLPAVSRYADLLRGTLVRHLRLTQSCLHWFDLLLLGDGRGLLREDHLGCGVAVLLVLFQELPELLEALKILFLGILLEESQPRFSLVQVGAVRSLIAACGAEELLEQLGTRSTVCLGIQSLQRRQVGRLGRLGLHLMQSWELHLGRGEQSAPVLEVVAVLHSHLLFLETVQKMRQGVEAQLLYLLLQLPIGELRLPSSGRKVVTWRHSVVVEVIADHCVLVR